MKYTYIIPLFFLLINCSSNDNEVPTKSIPEIQFIKTFGGGNNEVGLSATKTSDNGYAVLGYTQSNDGDITTKTDTSFDYLVLKYSSDDELLWSKTYGGSADDRGQNIIETSDNGFLVIGYTSSNDNDVETYYGGNDFWIVKLDSSGNISWQKTFGYIGNDNGIQIIQTSDSGFLIVGELDVSSSAGEGNAKTTALKHAGGDYWVIKLNTSGEFEWSRYYGGSFTDTPHGIVETDEGNFIITGTSDSDDVDISNNKGSYDIWTIKISNTGDLIWDKNYGGVEIDEAKAICKTQDGNILIVGNTRSSDQDVSTNQGGADLWLLKIDTNGNLLWEKTFGGSSFDIGSSIYQTEDGFIISGSSRSLDNEFTNQGQNDAWILKISSEGNQEWQKLIGGSNIDYLYDCVQLNDGSFIAVGESESSDGDITENKGFSDLLIIKIN